MKVEPKCNVNIIHDRLSDVRSEGTENEEKEGERAEKTIRRRKLRDDDD